MRRNVKIGFVFALSVMLTVYSPAFGGGAPTKDAQKNYFYSYENPRWCGI